MSDLAVDPLEIETRRREREQRLAAFELPLVRLSGSVLLSLAIYVHNRCLVPLPIERLAQRDGRRRDRTPRVSWALLVFFLRRNPPRDLTVAALVGDLCVWTFAIYCSGAEASWLFFILLLRVADQTQTTFRRALAFALLGDGLLRDDAAVGRARRRPRDRAPARRWRSWSSSSSAACTSRSPRARRRTAARG